ncbi:MAG TPA: hypothetical protein VJP07_02005 [Dehalococcoidia bacterium]|nr:hypothetical protein [Dehalococcoidia bacterium]
MSLTLVQIVRIPAEGIEAFQRFESRVLPLMPKYGGVLERRLRGDDGRTEVHVISFPSREALQRYMDDPERTQYVSLKDQSGAVSELIEMTDVAGD